MIYRFLYDVIENFINTINFPLTSITSKVFYDGNIKITEYTLYMITCKYIIDNILYIYIIDHNVHSLLSIIIII